MNATAPGTEPKARPARPGRIAFALAIPAALVAASIARRLQRHRHPDKPSVDWKLMSGNQIRFSPHLDIHPSFGRGGWGRRSHAR
jgi:hypothetical protein